MKNSIEEMLNLYSSIGARIDRWHRFDNVAEEVVTRKGEFKEFESLSDTQISNYVKSLFWVASARIEASQDPRLDFSDEEICKPRFYRLDLNILAMGYGKDSANQKFLEKLEIVEEQLEEQLQEPSSPNTQAKLNNSVELTNNN